MKKTQELMTKQNALIHKFEELKKLPSSITQKGVSFPVMIEILKSKLVLELFETFDKDVFFNTKRTTTFYIPDKWKIVVEETLIDFGQVEDVQITLFDNFMKLSTIKC